MPPGSSRWPSWKGRLARLDVVIELVAVVDAAELVSDERSAADGNLHLLATPLSLASFTVAGVDDEAVGPGLDDAFPITEPGQTPPYAARRLLDGIDKPQVCAC